MAKILSHVWSEVRGSVAGITYFPNQYHQIVARARTAPVNPNTYRQQQIRGAFDTAEEEWEGLSDLLRQLWAQYAFTCTFPGPLGDYKISGRLMYIRNRSTALYLDVRGKMANPIQTVNPLQAGFNALSHLDVTPLAAPGIGFEIHGTNPNAREQSIYSFRSVAFNPDRLRFKGPFLTETLDSAQAAAAAAYQFNFTGLVDGQVYFVVFRSITDSLVPFGHRLSFKHVVRAVATETLIASKPVKSPPKNN